MNYTSAQANKLLKKLNDEYTALLDKETRSRDFRAAMGEDVESVRDRKSTRLNSSHANESRMPSSA